MRPLPPSCCALRARERGAAAGRTEKPELEQMRQRSRLARMGPHWQRQHPRTQSQSRACPRSPGHQPQPAPLSTQQRQSPQPRKNQLQRHWGWTQNPLHRHRPFASCWWCSLHLQLLRVSFWPTQGEPRSPQLAQLHLSLPLSRPRPTSLPTRTRVAGRLVRWTCGCAPGRWRKMRREPPQLTTRKKRKQGRWRQQRHPPSLHRAPMRAVSPCASLSPSRRWRQPPVRPQLSPSQSSRACWAAWLSGREQRELAHRRLRPGERA